MAEARETRLRRVAGAWSLVLTHVGRKSGQPHEVRIWFVVDGDKILLGTADIDRNWVRNVQKTAQVKLAVAGETFEGTARFLADPVERERVMSRVRSKYWVFYPIIRLGDFLMRMKILRIQNGAFEVVLQGD